MTGASGQSPLGGFGSLLRFLEELRDAAEKGQSRRAESSGWGGGATDRVPPTGPGKGSVHRDPVRGSTGAIKPRKITVNDRVYVDAEDVLTALQEAGQMSQLQAQLRRALGK